VTHVVLLSAFKRGKAGERPQASSLRKKRTKGIRVDSSRTNYNGGVRSTGFSTGLAKKELSTANLVVEKAAKLDRGTFGVAVGQGPWQRRLEEIGGIKPLAFGQFGEMGPGLEALLASMAKRGADEMADRYLIENREAAVARGADVPHAAALGGGLRCGARKRRSSLVG
jgi:hypothetical protein